MLDNSGQNGGTAKHLNKIIDDKHLVSSALSNFVDVFRSLKDEAERKDFASKLQLDFKASKNRFEQSTLLLKMLYINMYSIDISWSHFEATKLLGDESYTIKRRCYLFMENCFVGHTDAAVMSINIILKDLKLDEKIIPLPLNTLSLIMTSEISQMVFDTLKIHNLHSSDELKLKTSTMIVPLARNNNSYPAEHITRMASALSISDDLSKLYVFMSVLVELISLFPDVQITFAPALLKIMRSRITDVSLVSKLFIIFKHLCQKDLKLLSKVESFIAEILAKEPNIQVFYEFIQFILQYPENFRDKEISLLILNSYVKQLGSSDSNTIYIALKLLNCYSSQRLELFVDNSSTLSNQEIWWKSTIEGINDLVAGQIKSPDRPIVVESVKYTTKTVNQKNVFRIVNGMMKTIAESKSDRVANSVFDQVLHLCTCNNYYNLMDKSELLEWFGLILIGAAQADKNLDYKQIIFHLNSIVNNYPDISVKLIGHLEDMINAFKLSKHSILDLDNSNQSKSTEIKIYFIASAIDIVTRYCENLKSITRLSQSVLQFIPKAIKFPDSLTLIKISLLKICTYSDKKYTNKPEFSHLSALKDAILSETELLTNQNTFSELNPFYFNLDYAVSLNLFDSSNLSEIKSEEAESEIEMPNILKLFQNKDKSPDSDKNNNDSKQKPFQNYDFLTPISYNGNLLTPHSANKVKKNNYLPQLSSTNQYKQAQVTKNPENSLMSTFEQLIIKEEANKYMNENPNNDVCLPDDYTEEILDDYDSLDGSQ